MTFPSSLLNDRTLHFEGYAPFQVRRGKWEKHREKAVIGGATSHQLVLSDDGLVARHRVTVNSVFNMKTDGDIQINIACPNWLGLDTWHNGAAHLISAGDSWRKDNWKGVKAPNAKGYWLNYADGSWKCKANKVHTCELSFVDNGDKTVLSWDIMYYGANNRVNVVRGNVFIDVRVNQMKRVAFNTNSEFNWASHHLEVV